MAGHAKGPGTRTPQQSGVAAQIQQPEEKTRMRQYRTLSVVCLLLACMACGAGDDDDSCRPGQQRCDGSVVQVCVADATVRSFVWRDVLDCTITDDACVLTESRMRATCAADDAGQISGDSGFADEESLHAV